MMLNNPEELNKIIKKKKGDELAPIDEDIMMQSFDKDQLQDATAQQYQQQQIHEDIKDRVN